MILFLKVIYFAGCFVLGWELGKWLARRAAGGDGDD